MFGTDLSTEYEAAAQLGSSARDCYQAGLRGALCDEPTRAGLRRHASQAGWDLG
jgi:aminodeoxyfutalosine deaminase